MLARSIPDLPLLPDTGPDLVRSKDMRIDAMH